MSTGDKLNRKLEALLALCSEHLFQGVCYVPLKPHDPIQIGPDFCQFCRRRLEHAGTEANCRHSILNGSYQALRTGEPYYSVCWLGLNSFVIPVVSRGELVGAIEIGGFFYEGDVHDWQFMQQHYRDLAGGGQATAEAKLRLLSTMESGPIRQAADFVMEALFAGGINRVEEFQQRQCKYLLQRRIAEQMHHYRRTDSGPGDVLALFPQLAACMSAGDQPQTLILLNDYFCRLLLTSGTNLEWLKGQIHLLLSLVTRQRVLAGHNTEHAVIEQFHRFQELATIDNLEDACYWTLRQMEGFFAGPKEIGHAEPSALADRAVIWLSGHYRKPVSLDDLARELGASKSALAKSLKQNTGRTFSEHLQGIRLNEAKYLLATTELAVYEIAGECGFYDASHFQRQFRATFDLSPGQFRTLMKRG